MKIYPLAALSWVNKDENIQPNKICSPKDNTFPTVIEDKFTDIIVSQAQPAFICVNSVIITVA